MFFIYLNEDQYRNARIVPLHSTSAFEALRDGRFTTKMWLDTAHLPIIFDKTEEKQHVLKIDKSADQSADQSASIPSSF